jgi:hypothetical protein
VPSGGSGTNLWACSRACLLTAAFEDPGCGAP